MPSHSFIAVLAVIRRTVSAVILTLSIAKGKDPDAANITTTARTFLRNALQVSGKKIQTPFPTESPSGSFDFVCRKSAADSAQDDGQIGEA